MLLARLHDLRLPLDSGLLGTVSLMSSCRLRSQAGIKLASVESTTSASSRVTHSTSTAPSGAPGLPVLLSYTLLLFLHLVENLVRDSNVFYLPSQMTSVHVLRVGMSRVQGVTEQE